MRYWSMVLHFYQPATQDPKITEQVANSCYLPLLRTLKGKKDVGLTVNISGSLLLAMGRLGHTDFFELVGDLVREGKLELLLSPMHHPLVPIAPMAMVLSQIYRGRDLALKQLWVEPVRGMFVPELAVEEKIFGCLSKEADFIIVDESAIGRRGLVRFGNTVLVGNDRLMCEAIRSTPKQIDVGKTVEFAKTRVGEDEVLYSVHDAEIFGHHYEERGEFFSRLLENPEFKFIKVSEAIGMNDHTEVISHVTKSSWQNCVGYGLWEGNDLQRDYLKLAESVYLKFEQLGNLMKESDREVAREHLDEGWASCHLYWLSNHPWWHPELVERGANNLIRCFRMLPVTYEEKAEAEKNHHEFLEKMWLYHWSGEVEKNYKLYDVEREKMLKELPELGM